MFIAALDLLGLTQLTGAPLIISAPIVRGPRSVVRKKLISLAFSTLLYWISSDLPNEFRQGVRGQKEGPVTSLRTKKLIYPTQ